MILFLIFISTFHLTDLGAQTTPVEVKTKRAPLFSDPRFDSAVTSWHPQGTTFNVISSINSEQFDFYLVYDNMGVIRYLPKKFTQNLAPGENDPTDFTPQAQLSNTYPFEQMIKTQLMGELSISTPSREEYQFADIIADYKSQPRYDLKFSFLRPLSDFSSAPTLSEWNWGVGLTASTSQTKFKFQKANSISSISRDFGIDLFIASPLIYFKKSMLLTQLGFILEQETISFENSHYRKYNVAPWMGLNYEMFRSGQIQFGFTSKMEWQVPGAYQSESTGNPSSVKKINQLTFNVGISATYRP